MLHTLKDLEGFAIHAADVDFEASKAFYFNDKQSVDDSLFGG